MLAWMGAGGAAVMATLFSRNEARAGHDGTNVLHLGEFNNAPAGTNEGRTLLFADAEGRALDVRNSRQGGPDIGAIQAWSRGGGPAVQGNATTNLEFPPTGSGVGLLGSSGSGPGVAGNSISGNAVEGHSQTGTGVIGHSGTGTGGLFLSGSGSALSVLGRANMTASVAAAFGDTLFVENQMAGPGGGGAISAVAHGDAHSVEGVANGVGVGVSGVAGGDPFGEGPGDGVHGLSGTGTGVDGNSASGIGVRARSASGIALAVEGTARFSTAGFASIPAGEDSAFVPNAAVTDVSHISVTLTSDPGTRQVTWVEGSPGAGFTVHTSKKTPETHFTYLIVEPE
jgi:hypothetical protein